MDPSLAPLKITEIFLVQTGNRFVPVTKPTSLKLNALLYLLAENKLLRMISLSDDAPVQANYIFPYPIDHIAESAYFREKTKEFRSDLNITLKSNPIISLYFDLYPSPLLKNSTFVFGLVPLWVGPAHMLFSPPATLCHTPHYWGATL